MKCNPFRSITLMIASGKTDTIKRSKTYRHEKTTGRGDESIKTEGDKSERSRSTNSKKSSGTASISGVAGAAEESASKSETEKTRKKKLGMSSPDPKKPDANESEGSTMMTSGTFDAIGDRKKKKSATELFSGWEESRHSGKTLLRQNLYASFL